MAGMTHRFLICLAVVAAFVGCDRDPRTRAEAVPPGETPRSETTKHFAGLTLGESSVADAESWFGESADAPSSKTGFAARSWATVDGIPGGKLEMHFDEQGKLRLIASTVKSVPEASAPAFDRLLGAQSERRSMFTHDGKVSHTWKWTKDDATFWLMSTPAKPRDETLTTFAGFLRTDLDALGEEELQSYGGMDSVFEMMPARGGLMAGEPFVVGSLRGSLTIPRFQPEFGTGDDSRRAPDGMLFLLTAMRVQNEGEETVPDPMPGWRLLGPDGDEIPRGHRRERGVLTSDEGAQPRRRRHCSRGTGSGRGCRHGCSLRRRRRCHAQPRGSVLRVPPFGFRSWSDNAIWFRSARLRARAVVPRARVKTAELAALPDALRGSRCHGTVRV